MLGHIDHFVFFSLAQVYLSHFTIPCNSDAHQPLAVILKKALSISSDSKTRAIDSIRRYSIQLSVELIKTRYAL